MSHLISNHDPYHVHKILGLLALLHYTYRFTLLFIYGDAFPRTSESVSTQVIGVAIHGLLSWSSLLLPLPSRRNFSKPLIWPEFRLHSITFATRHVVATILTLLDLWPPEDKYLLHGAARAVLLLGAIEAASKITNHYGDRAMRTTNSMPYPNTVGQEQRSPIKKSYALAQFAATAVCLSPDASLNFCPLLAIQMAPLMMTLVRKGKVTAGTYHRVYAISLYLGYIIVFVRLLAREGNYVGVPKSAGLKTVFMLCFPSSKVRKLVSPRIVWLINVVISAIVYPVLLAGPADDCISDRSARALFWFVTIVASGKQVMAYAPLFGATRLCLNVYWEKKKSETNKEGLSEKDKKAL